ncbi:hypothetical protein LTR37_002992 [Vermiconidia calcicola]|uniref:Uncharacterized protein n=1 Tax=Vermiconidia calcicola TaxID=1690605 RepID=A0ACC3NT68_9PEZI|nr:hypothetical protein LTR37_002992 [Vermiconidia calcicola]
MATSQGPDRIVIGVDFGTTFSGVAEGYSGTPVSADDVNVIKTWPGGKGISSDKVPSELVYDKTTKGSSGADEADGWSMVMPDVFDVKDLQASLPAQRGEADVAVRWGFQLRPDEARLRCMKLLLDPQQDPQLPSFVSKRDIKSQLSDSGKDAVGAVADYLRELYKHAMVELNKRYTTVFVENTNLQWILTVPAVWSDTAKNATLTAAKKAAMGPDIKLISEPEAAAVYTLQAIQPNHLKVDDSFIVVDAGGGTVDLISYTIKQARPLRIEEAVEGSGACCGAALLNAKFEEYVKSKLGNASFNRMCRKQEKTWRTALNYFEEYVKRNFDPTDLMDFNVPVPGLPDNEAAGVEQGFFTLFAATVASMFKPIITDVIQLVEGQMGELRNRGKSVGGIILVGGFGQSRCLYTALNFQYAGNHLPKAMRVNVMQPANAWTAVVRGAVLRGLEGTELVVSRKSRRHYGIVMREYFTPGIHPVSCKEWDTLKEVWMADNRMRWFIEKGQTVSSAEPVLFSFTSDFTFAQNKAMTQELIVCDDEVAPVGYTEASSSTKVLCKLVVPLSGVPTHLWEARQNTQGQRYEHLSFQLGMQVESGGLRFDMRVDGVVYGNVVATFD